MNDETSALSWAVAAGAAGEEVIDRWRWNRAIEVPIGGLWEAVRLTRDLGEATLHRLRRAKEPVGLVLEVPLRGAVEFLVPRGTAASWPTIGGTVAVADGTMRWPAPGASAANGRRAICGRRWLVAPAAVASVVTDADALCEAVAATIAHERFARSRAGDHSA
ncbi:hypothetical protein E1265_19105 [Streptomyces sp. 8K308]|uniref:hypothetical protein n=1 Tax=Streptomyces sp. 8K308 TaxID=2530388 RepID=UPI0010533190|nr:hypothetical protein [Streptomyces sp. 8K308]TDC21068.1 hypothetical protein E1265_19105 [Streptomyces sp. 8K308]